MMTFPETHMGPHLMLDCRKVSKEKTGDLQHVFNVLNELPERIGMTKITQPYVFPYSGLVPEDKGVTGVVVIAESHLTFHSFTEKDYFFFDMFSCKPFDVQAAMDYIREAFGVEEMEVHYVERGRDFPRSDALSGYPAKQNVVSLPVEAAAEPSQRVLSKV